ncbi:MAG TPA: hypothetical protein VFV52_03505 [Bacilli bacterium]|nr:hypothetical protein [Bacilli bacterium]
MAVVTLSKPTYEELAYIKHLWACPETNKYLGGPYPMTDPDGWYRKWRAGDLG